MNDIVHTVPAGSIPTFDSEEKTAFGAALASALASAPPKVTLDISDAFDGLTANVKRDIVWSFHSALNHQLLTLMLQHMRFGNVPDTKLKEDAISIDKFNDIRARLMERKANREHIEEIGFGVEMTSYDQAERVNTIRSFLKTEIEATEFANSPIAAFQSASTQLNGIEDAILFRVGRPQPMPSDEVLAREAAMFKMPIELLRQDYIDQAQRSTNDLVMYAEQIVDLVDDMGSTETFGESADAAMSSLPVITQLRIYVKLIQAHTSRMSRAVRQRLRRPEESGNYLLISTHRNELVQRLHTWCKEHEQLLLGLVNAGVTLPEIPAE